MGRTVGDGYPTSDAIRAARQAKGWSIADAVRVMKQRHGSQLPSLDSLIRAWKRWEHGTVPSRPYRPLLLDVLEIEPRSSPDRPMGSLASTAEIARVFPNQQEAAGEMRALAAHATEVDLLAVRGLGLVALNDSLLRPALEAATEAVQLRMLILRPDSDAAKQRAIEIGESPAAFAAGLELTIARLGELGNTNQVNLEVYTYDALPAWRLIRIDDTLYVSSFSEEWEGHESAVYKIVATPTGPLNRIFRRTFEDMRSRAIRII